MRRMMCIQMWCSRWRTRGLSGQLRSKIFVQKLTTPRAVWLMVPAAIVDKELESLGSLLKAGDIVIDGGNSFYHDDIRRAAALQPKGIAISTWAPVGVWGWSAAIA